MREPIPKLGRGLAALLGQERAARPGRGCRERPSATCSGCGDRSRIRTSRAPTSNPSPSATSPPPSRNGGCFSLSWCAKAMAPLHATRSSPASGGGGPRMAAGLHDIPCAHPARCPTPTPWRQRWSRTCNARISTRSRRPRAMQRLMDRVRPDPGRARRRPSASRAAMSPTHSGCSTCRNRCATISARAAERGPRQRAVVPSRPGGRRAHGDRPRSQRTPDRGTEPAHRGSDTAPAASTASAPDPDVVALERELR